MYVFLCLLALIPLSVVREYVIISSCCTSYSFNFAVKQKSTTYRKKLIIDGAIA